MATAPMAKPATMKPPAMHPQPKYKFKEFVCYQFSTATGLGAAGTVTLQQQIQAAADFELLKLTYSADIAAAAQTDSTRVIPLVTVLMQDWGSQRSLTGNNLPVPVSSMFGTGSEPFILPESRIFTSNSQIMLQLVNYSAASTYNLQFTLHGRHLWLNPAYQG